MLCFLPAVDANEDSNRVGNAALALLNEGKEAEGLAELKKAADLDPSDPVWHMNYGSVLFQRAQGVFNTQGRDASTPLFRKSEDELAKALAHFKEEDNAAAAQCHYLLGDIHLYVYENLDAAKGHYQKALKADPQHTGALQGMAQWASRSKAKAKVVDDAAATAAQRKNEAPPKRSVLSRILGGNKKILADRIVLKNGQSMECNVVEENSQGVWVEIEQGTKAYFKHSEVSKIVRGKQTVSGKS